MLHPTATPNRVYLEQDKSFLNLWSVQRISIPLRRNALRSIEACSRKGPEAQAEAQSSSYNTTRQRNQKASSHNFHLYDP